MKFGERVKTEREKRGLSREQVCVEASRRHPFKKSMSSSLLWRIEDGEKPSTDSVLSLCRVFDWSFERMMDTVAKEAA